MEGLNDADMFIAKNKNHIFESGDNQQCFSLLWHLSPFIKVIVIVVGGVLANSLALFTDVLHLASDLISYLISLLALFLAKKTATKRMTFGYYRAGMYKYFWL